MSVHALALEKSMPFGAAPAAPAGIGAARAGAFAQAQSHSRRVRLLKRVLPLAAVLLATGFGAFAYHASSAAVRIEADSSAVTDGHLVMSNPKLQGYTKEGRPYAVNATRAIQQLTAKDADVQLDRIDARLPLNAKDWISVNAPGGVYNRAANTLTLDGGASDGIKVVSSDNTTVSMHTAVIDMTSGIIRAKNNLDITRKEGALSAGTAQFSKDGKVVVFENKVRMTLQPNQHSPDQSGPNQSSKDDDANAKP